MDCAQIPRERPILFQGAMVRALLNGSKTQTRRIVKASDLARAGAEGPELWTGFMGWQPAEAVLADQSLSTSKQTRCPYGQPGDRLWVRETHRPIFGQTCGLINVDYRADPRAKWERLGDASDCLIKLKWTPSIHMRREYSRILLEIVSVRVERLHEISEADAAAEGWRRRPEVSDDPDVHSDAARDWYRDLWEEINGLDSWSANPWVWVVEFELMQNADHGAEQ